jgi:hypothetical protein
VIRVTVILCAVAMAGGCAYVSPTAEVPSAPPPIRPGTTPVEAEKDAEAKALEEAESRCATQGKHAVARRADNTTLYDCVSPGDAASGGNSPPSQ